MAICLVISCGYADPWKDDGVKPLGKRGLQKKMNERMQQKTPEERPTCPSAKRERKPNQKYINAWKARKQARIVCLFYQNLHKRGFFFTSSLNFSEHRHLGAFWQQRAERGWFIMNLILSPHIPALFMNYFTDTDCQEQNLSTQGHIS